MEDRPTLSDPCYMAETTYRAGLRAIAEAILVECFHAVDVQDSENPYNQITTEDVWVQPDYPAAMEVSVFVRGVCQPHAEVVLDTVRRILPRAVSVDENGTDDRRVTCYNVRVDLQGIGGAHCHIRDLK